jgi:hypothetical protein
MCYFDPMASILSQITTSGYGTESAGGLGRSDTLESVATSDSAVHKDSEKKRDIFQVEILYRELSSDPLCRFLLYDDFL